MLPPFPPVKTNPTPLNLTKHKGMRSYSAMGKTPADRKGTSADSDVLYSLPITSLNSLNLPAIKIPPYNLRNECRYKLCLGNIAHPKC
ncbi:hypothetical protein CEXT_645751 [Caerostris extrusa]|uniref:Uncharacterized protein n=1 Tax=Caerostris extrusa TaxID=172846 RepID=A0AAV4YBS3_CAEEX|nr:hypothetical protein CEXT_645751 [Caerostris extrusa]